MLDVFLTCDTEIWCPDWHSIDQDFPTSFDRYVHGRTRHGKSVGLPFQVQLLNDHSLHGVFFVEPLFAGRFGIGSLKEIIGIIRDGKQEVQLHLHTEWADEARERLLLHVTEKRQHLRYFSADEQATLIAEGARLIETAGGGRPIAFRAGSFGLNRDTLDVLPRCGIRIDSSYNATMLGPTSGVSPDHLLTDVVRIGDVVEYPISVFVDGLGRLRHAQLGACSFAEIEQALWAALEGGQRAFVLLFHNFELLNAAKTDRDAIVVRRFERLCRFLADHRTSFRTRGFDSSDVQVGTGSGPVLRASRAATGRRMVEQLTRRLAA